MWPPVKRTEDLSPLESGAHSENGVMNLEELTVILTTDGTDWNDTKYKEILMPDEKTNRL